MQFKNQPHESGHDAALKHAKSVTLDQLRIADEIVQSSPLFSRNGPGYAEARLVVAQMITQNYTAVILSEVDKKTSK